MLRDVSERVVIASKGRFGRAHPREGARRSSGLPHESDDHQGGVPRRRRSTCGRSGPSSARRVSHPAPFPVELPERFIRLYTYVGDVVLDPFLGSGSTAVAAARNGRRYVGYDLDPEYVAIAEARRRRGSSRAGRQPATARGD